MALAAGLLMGAAMKPDLEADNRPAGPQVIAEGPAAGSTGPFDDRTQAYAAYRGEIPDYVLGTDWKRATEWRPQPADVSPPMPRLARADEPPPPPILARAVYKDEPPPPRRYGYPTLGDELPRRAPVGQAVDDAYEEPDADR